MTRHWQDSTLLHEDSTARAGLFATAAYFEPPRDLRGGIASFLFGLGIFGAIMLAMALG
ncbi:MAG: hypothetical protein JNM30_09150 [Rhodospirillales bacterium]|nr:hypothetical protein [Rhodospirillales bacterium]